MPARVVHNPLRYTEIECLINLTKDCTQSNAANRSLGNKPFNKQSRPTRPRQALNDTNELLVANSEDCFLLLGKTDSRWSVFARLVHLPQHHR